MFISFDYKCLICDTVQSRFVKKSEMDRQYHCDDDPVPMIRLPAAPKTHFRFNDKKLKR